MSDDILSTARREEQRLVQELEKTSVFKKLQAVRALIRAYGEEPQKTAISKSIIRSAVGLAGSKATKTHKIIAAATAFVGAQPREHPYAPVRSIFNELQRQGIEIGGKDPVATLSAYLSNSGLFESDRRLGWRLKPPPDDESEKSRAPDEGNSSGAHVETGLGAQ